MMSSSAGDARADQAALSRTLAAASFAITVIVIGVPLWLKTTEVYRASIPYSRIAALQSLTPRSSSGAPVTVLADSESTAGDVGARLRRLVPDAVFSWRGFSAVEQRALVSTASGHDSSVWALDDALEAAAAAEGSPDATRIAVLPAGLDGTRSVWLGRYSSVFVTADVPLDDVAALLTDRLLGGDSPAASITRVRSSALYDILVSVVVPDPASTPVSVSAPRLICRRLESLVAQLQPLANISVKSQFLYHVGLGVTPRRDAQLDAWTLSEADLPLVITPLEARLGSVVSAGVTPLHFIVYVPPTAQRPLRVRPAAEAGEDAFISPRWGGVQVADSDPDGGLDTERVAAVVAVQLRRLLGIAAAPLATGDTSPFHQVTVRPAQLRTWELHSLRRLRTVENLLNARQNLASLASMLGRISNIVISDRVGDAVASGVDGVEAAVRLLDAGDDQEAFFRSRQALQASETAIYDPSMLALLYFPDDQKYAIYIPLFLPVSIPVVASLRSLYQFFRRYRAKVKSD